MKEVLSLFGDGNSPFTGAKAHADVCLKAVEALADVLTADAAPRLAAMKVVRALEGDADEIKGEVRRQLAGKLFLPVPRDQILALITRQDKIANRAQDVAVLFTNRFGDLSQDIIDLLHRFLDCDLKVVRQAHKSVNELDEMIATGFRGAEADRVVKMVEKLDKLESESDREQWRLFAEMKKFEDSVSPIDAMFLYRVTNLMAEIGDHADQTGRLLEQMLSK